MQGLLVFCILTSLAVSVCDCYHVLLYHNGGTKGNLIQIQPVIEEVLNRGHEVTSILYSTLGMEHQNYTEFIVPNGFESIYTVVNKLAVEGTGLESAKFWTTVLPAFNECIENVAIQPFKVESVEKFLKLEKKVDVVITITPLMGAVMADIFDCPLLNFSPGGNMLFPIQGTGKDINWSIQPLGSDKYIEPLTFFERLQSHIMRNVEKMFFSWFASRIHYHQQKKFGPNTRNPYNILRERLSVVLSSSHPVTHGSWPNMPNFIELGGLHLRDPKPLPKDLLSFIDSATKGVVFMAFGSQFKSKDLSEDKLLVFLETFKRLEMSVIWKWDADIPNLPKNVLVRSWLPQQDVLGHPNVRVFVTHGGLGSVMEAIYHKTVLVGLPMMNDQWPNILRAERHGYAKMLKLDTLSADELTQAIKSAVGNEDMKSSLERIHNVYVDNHQSPRDTAVWWIEYVCRNKGADILSSWLAYETPWYQYHHVDILMFMTAVILVMFSSFVLACYFCRKVCCKQKVKIE